MEVFAFKPDMLNLLESGLRRKCLIKFLQLLNDFRLLLVFMALELVLREAVHKPQAFLHLVESNKLNIPIFDFELDRNESLHLSFV